MKGCCVPDLKLGVHVKRKLSLLLGLLSDRRGFSLYTPVPTFLNQLFKIEIPSEKSFLVNESTKNQEISHCANPELNLSLRGTKIKEAVDEKFLDVIPYRHLDWTNHI